MKFHVVGASNHGEEKLLSNIFFLYLSLHGGDFIEQIKKLSYTLCLKGSKSDYKKKKKKKKSASSFSMLESSSFCYW